MEMWEFMCEWLKKVILKFGWINKKDFHPKSHDPQISNQMDATAGKSVQTIIEVLLNTCKYILSTDA